MLNTFVKVSNISNLSDARYCAGMGVEMLGFVMDETNEHYVSPDKFKEIKNWVSGLRFVGETDSKDIAWILEQYQLYGFDALQVNNIATMQTLVEQGLTVILRTIESDLANIQPQPFAFLVEVEDLDDWAIFKIKTEANNAHILLDAPFDISNLLEFLSELPLKGIALKGSIENRPGYKDYGTLMDILEVLDEA